MPTTTAISLESAIQEAVAHHNAGRLAEAEHLYRAILQTHPSQADANHNLGVIALQVGQPTAALPHLKAALATNPAHEHYNASYANALLATGQTTEAQSILQAAVRYGTNTPTIKALQEHADRVVLGALFNAGSTAQTETQARILLTAYPDSGFVWKVLGACLQGRGGAEALPALWRAVELMPEDAEAHNNLGNEQRHLEQLDDAVASYRRALTLKPDFAVAHNNMGNALHDLGHFNDAVASYRRALTLKPDYAEASNNLGNPLGRLGQLDEALACFHRALQIKPDYADAHNNLGNALRELGQLDNAAASYCRALVLQPDDEHAHNNLGNVLRDMAQLDRAMESYQRALAIKPNFAEAHSNLGLALQDLGQIDDACDSFSRGLKISANEPGMFSNLLFALNYHPDKSAEEIFAAYRQFDEHFGQPLRAQWRPHSNHRHTARRLKVGYVSPDFRQHACVHFLEPLLAHHDKQAVEVYAYAELVKPDAASARFEGYVDHWVPTRGLSDEALAERIRADGIDILVDLAGHTAQNRLRVFARKPAPVSVSWLGFGYTTGLGAIDYYLSDAPSVPAGSEGLFAERPWRMRTPCYAFRPNSGMGEVNALPALERGYVTFGTLTRAVRINHHTIRVWSALLKAVPDSRLVIDSRNFTDAAVQTRLADKFAQHGISRERLQIGFHSPPWNVLRGMDIGLDCFPHNSGTTLFESLYLGVPFVTLAGRPSVGRLGSSILHGLGHPEWIASSEAQYIQIAADLAADLPRLAALRAGLRSEMQHSALMDETGFARHVEAAYQGMFDNWAHGV